MNPATAASRIAGLLAQSSLFHELDPQELARIAVGTRELPAARSTLLFHKGDSPHAFYLVVYGQVKLSFLARSGAEKIIEIIGAGQSFGEAVLFLDRPYPVYAETLIDTLLLETSKTVLFAELEANPALGRKMLAGLSIRLHGLIHDVAAYTLDTTAQRLIGFLLSHTQEGGSGLEVKLPTTKAVLASRLHLTPETFSRILQELTQKELIHVHGRTILIRNLEGLRHYGTPKA